METKIKSGAQGTIGLLSLPHPDGPGPIKYWAVSAACQDRMQPGFAGGGWMVFWTRCPNRKAPSLPWKHKAALPPSCSEQYRAYEGTPRVCLSFWEYTNQLLTAASQPGKVRASSIHLPVVWTLRHRTDFGAPFSWISLLETSPGS